MSTKTVYDFENIVEAAIKQLITDTYPDMVGFTSGQVLDFDKDRPRYEVYFVRGSGQLRYAPRASLPAALQASKIESAWKASITFQIITAVDEDGKTARQVYATNLRAVTANLELLLNETYLPLHCIKCPRDTGDARHVDPQEGYESLTMSCEVDFSVQANAWVLLTAAD